MSSASHNAKLFINYRREDTAPYAGRLYDRLMDHFGQDQVFIDIDQIEPGEDFVEAINRKVGSCDIAIVSIGPDWLTITDASGNRRLDDPEDFVRMEIVAALQRKIRVIPILVGGARMPRKQDLPADLAALSRRNALELSETRFHADVDRLIEAIEKPRTLPEKKIEPATVPIAAAPLAEPVPRPDSATVSQIAQSRGDHPSPAPPSFLSNLTPFARNVVLAIGVAIALGCLVWSFTPRRAADLGAETTATETPVDDASPAETPADAAILPPYTDMVAAAQAGVDSSSPSILDSLMNRTASKGAAPDDWMQEIRNSAENGSADAQFQMGMFYEFGYTGLEADSQQAANWYFKAGRQGHVLAREGARDLLQDTGEVSEAEAIEKDERRGARQKAYSDFLSEVVNKMNDRAREAIKNIKGG